MKRVALSLIVVLAALLSACEIAPTDTSGIKVGATRATVEGVLGKPVKSMQTDSGRIDTYKYNRGYTPTPTGGSGGGCYDPYCVVGMLAILAVVGPIAQGINYEDQRGDIEVAYGPDDTVVGIGWAPGDIEEAREARKRHDETLARAQQGDAEAQFQAAMLSSSAGERRKWLSLAANQGHAEAQFRLYTRDKPDGESLTWLCLAANQGHALAQEELGDLHVQGLGRPWREAGLVKLDRVRAYMWYSLAAANGLTQAGSTRDYIDDQMTPAQIAEAEKLAAEWKPGDCGAEDRTAKSTN